VTQPPATYHPHTAPATEMTTDTAAEVEAPCGDDNGEAPAPDGQAPLPAPVPTEETPLLGTRAVSATRP
jgi:hypothetical protein